LRHPGSLKAAPLLKAKAQVKERVRARTNVRSAQDQPKRASKSKETTNGQSQDTRAEKKGTSAKTFTRAKTAKQAKAQTITEQAPLQTKPLGRPTEKLVRKKKETRSLPPRKKAIKLESKRNVSASPPKQPAPVRRLSNKSKVQEKPEQVKTSNRKVVVKEKATDKKSATKETSSRVKLVLQQQQSPSKKCGDSHVQDPNRPRPLPIVSSAAN